MMLLVVSKVKQLAKAGKLNSSMEFIEELSKQVGLIVIASAKECKANDMKTLKARHLTIPCVEELEAKIATLEVEVAALEVKLEAGDASD